MAEFEEISWGATIRPLRADFHRRLSRAKSSLAALQDQDGLFASEHRAIIRLYCDILDDIDKHDTRRRTAST